MKTFGNPLWIIVLLFLLCVQTSSTLAYVNNTYHESRNNLTVVQTVVYRDETILVLLTGPSNSSTQTVLEFRLIFSNGTIKPFSVTNNLLGIQKHVYQIHPLNSNYFILGDTLNITAIFSLLDWNGNILVKNISSLYTYFNQPGFITFFHNGNQQYDTSPYQLILNDDSDKEFFGLAWNSSFIHWAIFQYKDPKQEISLVVSDTLLASQLVSFMDVRAYSLIDGGYAITQVTYNMSSETPPRPNATDNPNNPWDVSIVFIHQNSTPQMTQPFLIYQTPELLDSMYIKSCHVSIQGSGYECLLSVVYAFSYQIKQLSFLSSGANLGPKVIAQFANFSSSFHGQYKTENSLPYGGLEFYEPIAYSATNVTNQMTISVILPNSTRQDVVNVSYDFSSCSLGLDAPSSGIYLNNTVWILFSCPRLTPNQWSLISQDLPKYIGKDIGYHNLAINQTNPIIDASISLNSLSLIISFNFPVILSSRNISIFKSSNDGFRQTIPAQSGSCSVNSRNVNCTVLPVTFNQPDTEYYVVVDPDFVRSAEYNEPLAGIKPNLWKFKTHNDDTPNVYAETATVLTRFTAPGTTYFLGLSENNRSDFLDQLQSELAESVPVNLSRITKTSRFVADPGVPDHLLLKFSITSTNSLTEMNTQQIFDTLNIMLKNKGISPVGRYTHTALLDDTYGFIITPNLWEKYRIGIIYLVIGILLLGLIVYFARRRNPQGKSFEIFKVVLIVLDLTLDVLFVVTNGKNVPSLYTPAVVILVLSIVLNSIFAFGIFVHEITSNKEYVGWYSKYGKVASLFTLFATADVEILLFLRSEFAGFSVFYAPFTEVSLRYIFLGRTLNIFTENIPQFVLQILYYENSISYDIIPLLTLVTSSIVLLNDLISHAYELIKYFYYRYYSAPPDQDKA
ncbi:3105_t:CDS:10 [Acaulospora morrowiae]|uniref:3105_t:CDS:1 n=1 Tax=Acaulospora morrowiae TaxID=94023 RepID=A0A9N8WG54_9GLOM|nr:3105_t:CDS:10 [Acaulospora morrowiae]